MRRARVCIPALIAALALLVPAGAGAAIERTVSVTASATLKVPNTAPASGSR